MTNRRVKAKIQLGERGEEMANELNREEVSDRLVAIFSASLKVANWRRQLQVWTSDSISSKESGQD